MGTPGLADPAAPPDAAHPQRAAALAKRPVMSRLTVRVTVPVGVLVVVWAGLTAAMLGGAFGSPPGWLAGMAPGSRTTVEAAGLAGGALIIAVLALVLATRFVRALARETSDLADAARQVTDVRLPDELRALRAEAALPAGAAEGGIADGGSVGLSAGGSAELGQVADAIMGLHRAALSAATAEASLRNGLRNVLVSLGRRNQSLVHRQLRIIDKLEKQANGSTELRDLFTLDHLTTRMRRHAESLAVLAGEAAGRTWSTPVPVIDVMRAAAAEVEDYKRVVVRSDADQSIAAPAVTDMIHLLAELIENATLFSPSSTKVEVRAESVANGFVIEVEDRGLGIPADQLREINARLAVPPDEDLADADRLGLYVAAKLAARHRVHVSLAPSAYRGTKAVVVMPNTVVVATAPDAGPLPGGQETGPGRLNLRAPGVLALAGRDRAYRSAAFTSSGDSFPGGVTLSSGDSFPGGVPLSSGDSFPAGVPLSSGDSFPGGVPLSTGDSFPGGVPSAWDALPRRDAPREVDGMPAGDFSVPGDFRSPSDPRPGSGEFPAVSDVYSSGGFLASPHSASDSFPGSLPGGLPGNASFPASTGVPRDASLPGDTGYPGEPGFPPDTGADPAQPVLPRRVRPDRSAGPRHRQGPAEAPVPDQARSLASSLQRSWRLSQQEDDVRGPGSSEEAS